MSISDADFQLWLETPGKYRCALFDVTFAGDGGGYIREFAAHISNMPFVTDNGDSPANQIYDDCVIGVPAFSRAMGEALIGRSTQSYGDVIWTNENGVRNDWFSMNWDGRRIVAKLGDPSWPIADFRTVLDGTILDVFDQGGGKGGFHIADKSALLTTPMIADLLGGTGPDAEKLMPIIYGYSVFNISPKLIDEITHTYRFTGVQPIGGTGPVEVPWTDATHLENPSDVRESGVSLKSAITTFTADKVTNLLTVAGHGFVAGTRIFCPSDFAGFVQGTLGPTIGIEEDTNYWVIAAGLTANTFQISQTQSGAPLAIVGNTSDAVALFAFSWTVGYDTWGMQDGTFTLTGNPIGPITCDCYGLQRDSVQMVTVSDLIKQAFTSTAGTVFSYVNQAILDLDYTNLTAFASTCPQKVGIYITERMTVAEFLDALLISVGGWWSFSRDGLLQCGRLELPVAGAAVYSFVADDVALRTLKLDKRILPRKEIKLTGQINYTPQEQVAGSVEEYDVARFKQPFVTKTGTATVATWRDEQDNHRNAVSPAAYKTLLVDDTEQQTETDRLATMFQKPTGIFTFDTHQATYLLELGDLIYMEHSKFTGYGHVVRQTESIKGRALLAFFCQLPDVYPFEDVA